MKGVAFLKLEWADIKDIFNGGIVFTLPRVGIGRIVVRGDPLRRILDRADKMTTKMSGGSLPS